MAITRQGNFLGQMRVDASDLRSLESAAANDFDLLAGKVMGGQRALVVRGFTIDTTNTLNNPATNLQLLTADGILMHWGATEAGTLLSVPSAQAVEVLNSGNANVIGGFASGVLNYVGIDYSRSADATTSDVTKFVSAATNQESTNTVPKARTLSYRIIISTTPFSLSTNICPVARVQTDSQNRVTAVTDCRQLFGRLARGGDVPDASAGFTWADSTRRENAITYASGSTANPFAGGDKGIASLKSWMDAVMHVLWEAKSGESWYSQTSRDSMKIAFVPNGLTSGGSNFSWTIGTSTLTWSGIFIAFENSSGGYYNAVTDGSGVIADGQCLYVDINRTTANVTRTSIAGQAARTGGNLVTVTTSAAHGYTNGQTILVTSAAADLAEFPSGTQVITYVDADTFTYAQTGSNVSTTAATTYTTPTYVAAVGTLQSLPPPTIPGSRLIIAWRIGADVFIRDYPFEVGRQLSPVATTSSDGIVRLHQTPNDGVHPTVLAITGANNSTSITASGGSVNALTGTGSGSGAGLKGFGGDTAPGVFGIGGTTSGPGVKGAAFIGDNNGVEGYGLNAGNGVYGEADGTGAGVKGLGGTTAGNGVEGTGRNAGHGVRGNGSVDGFGGTGYGILGVGYGSTLAASVGLLQAGYFVQDDAGATVALEARCDFGAGIYARGSTSGVVGVGLVNGIGVDGAGTGTGTGVRGTGGATNGIGVDGIGGGTGVGVRGTSTSGTGVSGNATTGNGVYGIALSSGGRGVVGAGESRGVYGFTDSGQGVVGETTSGIGGYFLATGTGVPLKIEPSAAPAAPTNGAMYIDSTTGKLNFYWSGSWRVVTSTP